MRKIVKQIWDELKKKPEVRKFSTSNIAGRLLIGFLITMVLLTMVSRTADSITVAKIDVTTGNSGYLNYLVKGTGTLIEKAEKYIDIFEGVRIVAVYTKEGELVEKGENLFQYDTKDLEDKLDDLEDDLRKAEIAMEISNLNSITETKTSGIERAELTLERAKIDLESAKEDLIEAIETVETKKIGEYELAKEAYEEAKTTRDEQLENKDKALKDAADKVTETEEDLSELYENKVKAQSVISEYKNAINNTSVDALIIAETNIYKQYYGDEEYSQHQKDVKKAKKSLQRAEEDYSNAKEEKGIDLTDSEGAIYRRAIDDAEDEVEALTEDDVELQNAIITYNNAVRNNNEEFIEKAYQVLFELLYEEDQDKKKQIEKASDAITDSREALEDTTKQWKKTIAEEEKKVEKALESLEEAELTYLDIVSETYDYSKDVKTEEAVVESTTRAVEDAKLNLEETKKEDSNSQAKDISNQQISNLNTESAEIDIKEKQEAVALVKEILDSGGNILSPVTGVVSKLELMPGNNTLGTEKFAITTGDYSFVAKISKEDAKRLVPGDEMEIKLGNASDKEMVTIDTIGYEDIEGQVEITGMLPKDQCEEGSIVEFTIRKQSEQYDVIIPIQALRMDAKGNNYVLVTREKNTVLGNELTAFRIDITLLDKDGISAAIEGGLLPTDPLIISSSKYIEEGDRVRINESNEQKN